MYHPPQMAWFVPRGRFRPIGFLLIGTFVASGELSACHGIREEPPVGVCAVILRDSFHGVTAEPPRPGAKDGREALVYYEGHCGGLCGEGGCIWAQRDDRAADWRLARKVVGWQA